MVELRLGQWGYESYDTWAGIPSGVGDDGGGWLEVGMIDLVKGAGAGGEMKA